MAENQGAEAAAATTTDAAEVVESTESTETSAETENTESAETDSSPGPVPYARFKQVNEKAKRAMEALERQTALNQELQSKLDGGRKPEPQPSAEGIEELPDPPEHLTPGQKITWYTQQGAKRMIEKELGMSLGDAKMLLSVNRELGQDYAERTWTNLCAKVGGEVGVKLEPSSQDLRKQVSELTKRGADPSDALELVAVRMARAGKGNGTTVRTAAVEDGGVTPTMTQERFLPMNAKQAAEAAHKGKRAPHVSVEEIFQAVQKR